MKKSFLDFVYFFLLLIHIFSQNLVAHGFNDELLIEEEKIKNLENCSCWLFPSSKIKVNENNRDENFRRFLLTSSTLLSHILIAPAIANWLFKNKTDPEKRLEKKMGQDSAQKQNETPRKRRIIKKGVLRRNKAQSKNIDTDSGTEKADTTSKTQLLELGKKLNEIMKDTVSFDSQKHLLATMIASGGQEIILLASGDTDIKNAGVNITHNAVITLSGEVVTNVICDQLGITRNGGTARTIRSIVRIIICYGTWSIRGILQSLI